MIGQWEQVKINEIKKDYGKADYAKIYDDENGLHIILVFENEMQIEFLFESSALSYTVCDEGRRLKTIDFILKQYGEAFFEGGPVYMVFNSRYMNWFHEESYGIISEYAVSHYAFITSNDIIDVLTAYAPVVRVLNGDKEFGEEYEKRAEYDISEALKIAPYLDKK